jgi:hypothetical protein
VLKQAEWDAQILRWEQQKRSELYKKFFVGNLKWTDITVEGNKPTHLPSIDYEYLMFPFNNYPLPIAINQ